MQIFVINLPSAVERRKFQEEQLSMLGLNYEIIDATSIDDISNGTYKKHHFDWQRPLKNTEVACYYSHKLVWQKVIDSNKPALILEDDALLSKCVPVLLKSLASRKNVDLINLENRNRKKFVSKSGENIECNSKLFNLYQDRTGAAGYILWPSGAEKLITCEQKKGIALADAHITACHSLKSYQVEPTPIIQLDRCSDYGIDDIYSSKISSSTVSSSYNPKDGVYFWLKRIYAQIRLGLRQLRLIKKSNRRYIKIKIGDYDK